jgi:hypothetical protein
LVAGSNPFGGLEMLLRGSNGGSLRFRDAGPMGDPANPTTEWADGAWHHLAFGWRLGAGTSEPSAHLYLDGVPLTVDVLNNDFLAGDAISFWDSPFIIGGSSSGEFVNANFRGRIDDFRVYDELLPEDVVQILAIPEPSAFALLSVGLAFAWVRRRRPVHGREVSIP